MIYLRLIQVQSCNIIMLSIQLAWSGRDLIVVVAYRLHGGGIRMSCRERDDDVRAVLVGNKMLVFGGNNGQRMTNDLFELNLDTLNWTKQTPSSKLPGARAGHSCTAYKDRYLIIFGGGDGTVMFNDICIYDIELNSWLFPFLGGAPSGRCAHCAVIFDNSYNMSVSSSSLLSPGVPSSPMLVIFGGSDTQRRFNNVYTLDLGMCVL